MKVMELFVQAIILCETGGDPNAVGDGGRSIGPAQISRAWWDDVMTERSLQGKTFFPYKYAFNPELAACVALEGLLLYEKRIRRKVTHRPLGLKELYMLYNMGPTEFTEACKTGVFPAVVLGRAERVVNTYAELVRKNHRTGGHNERRR